MRLYFCFILLLSLAGVVLAWGERGAAERAIYYAVYLQEEIFTDPSSFRVAPQCKGSRVGMRGQRNRCTLKEFCERIWKKCPNDTRMRKDAIWPRKATDTNVENLTAKLSAEGIKDLIWENIEIPNPEWSPGLPQEPPKKIPIPGDGFTGNVNMKQLLPSMNVDYFTGLPLFGDLSRRARAEIDAQSSSLTRSQQNFFKRWTEQAEIAVDMTINLRTEDKWKALSENNRLVKALGFEPAYDKVPRQLGCKRGYSKVNPRATVRKLAADLSIIEAVAWARFQLSWYSGISTSEVFQNHQRALFAVFSLKSKMRTAC